jgi:hypothetical protein
MVLRVWYVPKLPGHRLLSRALILHLTDSPDPQRLAGVDRVRDSWADLHIFRHLHMWFDSCVQKMDCRSQLAGRRRRRPCVAFRAVAAGCLFGSLCCTGVKAFVPRHTSVATSRRYVAWPVTTDYYPDIGGLHILCRATISHHVMCVLYLYTVEQRHVRALSSRQ